GVYVRSAAYGYRSPGPKMWQCASQAPGGARNLGVRVFGSGALQVGMCRVSFTADGQINGKGEWVWYRIRHPAASTIGAVRDVHFLTSRSGEDLPMAQPQVTETTVLRND